MRTFRRDVLVPFVASLLLLVSKALVARSDALVPSSFLLLVVRPGATSSIFAPFVAMPFVPSSNVRSPVRSFLFLLPSSVFAPKHGFCNGLSQLL